MFRKLKHKSVDELWFRARTLVEKKVEKLLFKPDAWKQMVENIPMPASAEEFFQHPRRANFFFYPQRQACREMYVNELPDDLQESLRRADQFMRLEFDMLGAQFSFQERIPWHVNPATGREYPKAFYQDITIFSDDGKTDIKHVWEINRHQYFIELAKAYFLTGKDVYAQHVMDLFEDWVNENPYKIGVNWTSALEVAVRAYSWIWSLYFLADSPLLTPERLRQWMQELYLHGQFIRENLSFYFSPYNHLIGEVSALFMIGYLFPEFPPSREWETTAWNILVDELPRQFHPDGITVEQAMFYHHFTLGFYLMPVLVRQQNGDPVPREMLTHLERIFEFNALMTKPDGTFPWVGDIDNARSVYFRKPEQWDFRNVLAIGAYMFQRGDFKYVAGKSWEEILWFFGVEGWERYRKISPKPPATKQAVFRQSGYGVARSDWSPTANYCWMDVGPMAEGVYPDDTPSAAHGHADMLHFEITAGGQNFLVDSGFHNYRGNFEWHRHFRLTRAHNTIEVDGQSQAVHGSRMMLWSFVPEPDLRHVIDRPELFYLRATHSGFERLPGKPQHIRNFFFVQGKFWVIWDELPGSGEHHVDAYLHFNADCTVRVQDQKVFASLEGQHLCVLNWGDLQQLEVKKGGEKPEDGWISPLYRHATPATQLKYSARVPFPARNAFFILPYQGEARWSTEDHTTVMRHKGGEYRIAFDPRSQLPVEQLYFFAEALDDTGGIGVVFGRRQQQYLIRILQKQNQEWHILQEESFEG